MRDVDCEAERGWGGIPRRACRWISAFLWAGASGGDNPICLSLFPFYEAM